MNISLKLAVVLLSASAPWQAITAQTASEPPPAPSRGVEEEIVELSPFEVVANADVGYVATQTLAGTRIRTDLRDVGSAISVITKEFLSDIGATDNSTLLQYTTNAEVAGTRGTYAGVGNGQVVDETSTLRAPQGAQRVRGLAAADNTRDFFVTDIPWDAFNVDRVDIQRGPNSILFGLGSPAGIVNATTRSAEFRNVGNVDLRFGSYGSRRGSLDVNEELIDQTLAVRIDGLWSEEKFQQTPSFQDDKRVFAAVRFDPQLFSRRDFRTSLKVKYEKGDIEANRPRILPPVDQISPWFRPDAATPAQRDLNSGMGQRSVNLAYDIGSQPTNFSPWLASDSIAQRQQPIWFMDGSTNQLYRIYSGFINTGRRSTTGAVGGQGDALIAQRDSSQFFGLTDLRSYATNARLPNAQYGQYRNMSLRDDSVFNFYDNLIDGSTKSEFEKWDAYNVDLTQTAFDDRLAVQFTYDRQKYHRGGESLLGNPTLNIDILRNFQDRPDVAATAAASNPNYGRPYVVGGPGTGNSHDSDRKYARGSLFAEFRAADVLKNDFLVKLLGRHRFNGVYSDEKYSTENRSWQMHGTSREWDAYWTRSDGSSSPIATGGRPPIGIIYLGPTLANATTAAGANIPRILAPVGLDNGNVYHFASTWTNPPGVNFADPWTTPANLQAMFDPTQGNPNPSYNFTQASNPANYVGWNTGVQINLLRYNDGEDLSLLTNAQKSKRSTKSYAGSWQAFIWNDAIIPTLGWRYDEVKSQGVSARPVTLNRSILNLSPLGAANTFPYALPEGNLSLNANQTYSLYKDHSTAGGVVVHLNRLLGDRDFLPLNVSLSYNKSNNFQVTDARYNIYGQPIPNPTGATKDYGVLLSTKDERYTFRAVKYETKIANASTTTDLSDLIGNPLQQGLRFRNVFLYRLSLYDWSSREQTDLTPGRRYFWTPAYIDSAGRPVADLNGNPAPVPAGAVLETQAQADAHRDAVITAWNNIQRHFEELGYFRYWGYTPTTSSALTDRATYEATLTTTGSTDGRPIPATQYQPDISTVAAYGYSGSGRGGPQGFTVTNDTVSEGYEFELTANPLPNWRVALNASKTTAVRSNVGGQVMDDFITYMDAQMAGVAGDLRQFNGNYVAGNEIRQNWNQRRAVYTLMRLQENAAAPEIRKWRYNVITNYSFREGRFKGIGVGASYRWQDKVIIGYPVIPGTGGQASFDLANPYYGPSEDATDLWLSYERKLSDRIDWKIQLNVRNAFADDGVIPISVQPDGQTWAAVRIKPVQEWFVTNTFSF